MGRERAFSWPLVCPAFPRTVLVHLPGFPCLPERFWYCRLALNHKVLHYGDLDDSPQGEVTFESLQEKSKSSPRGLSCSRTPVSRSEFCFWLLQTGYLASGLLFHLNLFPGWSVVISTWLMSRSCLEIQ